MKRSRRSKRGRPKGPPKVRIQAYISPELEVAIFNEANDREITIGALIEEAFHTRVVVFTKTPEIR